MSSFNILSVLTIAGACGCQGSVTVSQTSATTSGGSSNATTSGVGVSSSAGSAGNTTTSGASGGTGGASGTGGAGTGGSTTGSDVTGTMVTTYYPVGAPVNVPVNLQGAVVEALVWDGGMWTHYPGMGDPKGNFVVPGVPQGPFMISVAGNYAYTSARTLDLGWEVAGRANAVAATNNATLSGTLTNLSPWQVDLDTLQLNAPNAPGASGPLSTSLTAGSTTLSGQLSPYWAFNLIDASQGDVLYATQLSGSTVNAASVQTISRFVSIAGIEQEATGDTPNVSGALSAVTANESTTLDLHPSQFDALASSVSPDAMDGSSFVAIATAPGALIAGPAVANGFTGVAPYLMIAGSGTMDVTLSSLPYGNPFDPSWGEILQATEVWTPSWNVPGSSKQLEIFASVSMYTPMPLAPGASLVPVVSPVQAPEINGQSAFGTVNGAGLTPTISWKPPAIGSPTAYYVDVYDLATTILVTTGYPGAGIVTTSTSVPLPPGMLKAGESYGIIITAVVSPIDASTKPFHMSATFASADVVSGVITP